MFIDFDSVDCNGIYVKNGPYVTQLSKAVFGDWGTINEGWNISYDQNSNSKNKDSDKYIETRKKFIKK